LGPLPCQRTPVLWRHFGAFVLRPTSPSVTEFERDLKRTGFIPNLLHGHHV
jgi:hypothetical protein